MPSHSSLRAIAWRQVWALAILLAAVLFGFMIYGFYQPLILRNVGFTTLATQIGIVQGLLGALVEPLLGGYSDRILVKTGSRLPQITVGITIAGLLFVAIAGLLPVASAPIGRWLLLILMNFWLVAMIAIRGPIVALLRQFAPVDQLPIANEVLILVIGLVGAIGPLLGNLLQSLSLSIVFMVGAIVLMVTATGFYRVAPPAFLMQLAAGFTDPSQPLLSRWQLARMMAVGIGTSYLLNLLLISMPPVLHRSLPGLSSSLIAALLLFIAAVTANGLGKLTQRWGAARAMQVGLGAIAGLFLLLTGTLSSMTAIGVLVSFGIAFGLVFISMVPFALERVPLQQTGLSTGLFFGGSGVGAAIVLGFQQGQIPLTGLMGFGMAAIGYGLTAYCLHHAHLESIPPDPR